MHVCRTNIYANIGYHNILKEKTFKRSALNKLPTAPIYLIYPRSARSLHKPQQHTVCNTFDHCIMFSPANGLDFAKNIRSTSVKVFIRSERGRKRSKDAYPIDTIHYCIRCVIRYYKYKCIYIYIHMSRYRFMGTKFPVRKCSKGMKRFSSACTFYTFRALQPTHLLTGYCHEKIVLFFIVF